MFIARQRANLLSLGAGLSKFDTLITRPLGVGDNYFCIGHWARLYKRWTHAVDLSDSPILRRKIGRVNRFSRRTRVAFIFFFLFSLLDDNGNAICWLVALTRSIFAVIENFWRLLERSIHCSMMHWASRCPIVRSTSPLRISGDPPGPQEVLVSWADLLRFIFNLSASRATSQTFIRTVVSVHNCSISTSL